MRLHNRYNIGKFFEKNDTYYVELRLFPREKITLPFYPGDYQDYFLERIVNGSMDYGAGEIIRNNYFYMLNLSVKKRVDLDYEPYKDRGSRAKGLTIPTDALKDIGLWFRSLVIADKFSDKDEARKLLAELRESKAPRFERVGLNREHAEEWDLSENPTRPGEYQWEAPSDGRAEGLIVGSIGRHWNTSHVEKIKRKENAGTR